MSDKGDATASITVLDTRSQMAVGAATNTNPLWIKGLGIRVPMHREFRLFEAAYKSSIELIFSKVFKAEGSS